MKMNKSLFLSVSIALFFFCRGSVQGISFRCRLLLKHPAPLDTFEDPTFACPFEDTGNPPEDLCNPSLALAPKETPRYLPEANRLPNLEFEEMVLGEFSQTCRDVFSSLEFSQIVSAIPSMDIGKVREGWGYLKDKSVSAEQAKMATVFRSTGRWSYCHRFNKSIDATIHAQFVPNSKSIVLFRTSCDTSSVYYQSLDPLNLGHRFVLVSAHELGHLVDFLAGRDLRRSGAEDYATYIGTFFAQCFGRIVRKIMQENIDAGMTQEQKKERENMEKRYACFEEAILDIRESTLSSAERRSVKKKTGAETFQVGTFQAFSCATPNK